MLLGTVKGDLHDIGKNLVAMMCEGAGFEVIDIGFNADPEKFVEAVKQHQPQVVGMSAMLTTTMRAMGYTIKALEEAGLRDQGQDHGRRRAGGCRVRQADRRRRLRLERTCRCRAGQEIRWRGVRADVAPEARPIVVVACKVLAARWNASCPVCRARSSAAPR